MIDSLAKRMLVCDTRSKNLAPLEIRIVGFRVDFAVLQLSWLAKFVVLFFIKILLIRLCFTADNDDVLICMMILTR